MTFNELDTLAKSYGLQRRDLPEGIRQPGQVPIAPCILYFGPKEFVHGLPYYYANSPDMEVYPPHESSFLRGIKEKNLRQRKR